MYLTNTCQIHLNTSQYTSIHVREEYTPFSGGINPTPLEHVEPARSANGGYTLGPSGRRLQNVKSVTKLD